MGMTKRQIRIKIFIPRIVFVNQVYSRTNSSCFLPHDMPEKDTERD